jgi:hypothetical protein
MVVGMSNCPRQTISTDSELSQVFGDATRMGVLARVSNKTSDTRRKRHIAAKCSYYDYNIH